MALLIKETTAYGNARPKDWGYLVKRLYQNRNHVKHLQYRNQKLYPNLLNRKR